MRYAALGDFYRKTEAELYTDLINFSLMSDQQLAILIQEGLTTYNKLFPPKGINPLIIVAVCVVAVAAVAAAAAGSAGAGAAASSASAASAATPGITSVAASTGATTGGVMNTVQSVAKYVSSAGKLYSKATGKNPPSDLMAAADVISSPSSTAAVKSAVSYQLQEKNLKVDSQNKKANAALDVMIEREKQKYAMLLKQKAEKDAKATGVEIVKPAPPISGKELAAMAIPVVLFLLS